MRTRASHAPTVPLPLRRSWPVIRPHLILNALIIIAAGCTPAEPPEPEIPEGEPLYFEPIGYGRRASLTDTVKIEVAIRDRTTWEAYRDSLNPIAPFDSVDFSQAFLLLAALPQTTSGYSIDFVSVEALDSAVVAEYVLSEPSEDCLTSLADVVPFQVVLVRRTDLPVRFHHTVEEYRCTFGPRR